MAQSVELFCLFHRIKTPYGPIVWLGFLCSNQCTTTGVLKAVVYAVFVEKWYNIYFLCSRSSDQSPMVDLLSYFLSQPMLHNWCNKGFGMFYIVCGMVHLKDSLLLIRKSSPCGSSRFSLSLFQSSSTTCPAHYKCVLLKTLSFLKGHIIRLISKLFFVTLGEM